MKTAEQITNEVEEELEKKVNTLYHGIKENEIYYKFGTLTVMYTNLKIENQKLKETINRLENNENKER
jgi:allophanate hydrolase subunit 1